MRPIRFLVTVAVLISLLLFFNGKENRTLNIKGSTTIYPIIIRCVDIFKKDHSEARIAVAESGSGSGIAALLDGTADIAMSSRPLTEKQENIITEKGLGIDRIVMGRDGIAIIVNAQNPTAEPCSTITSSLPARANSLAVMGPPAPVPTTIYSVLSAFIIKPLRASSIAGGGKPG